MILRNFVVFEGIDGTGTTTQIERLKSAYALRQGENQNLIHFTCEPTSGEIGRLIRRALRGEIHFTPDTMARLFSADRGEHLFGENGIESLIAQGKAVFSDRYLFSSLAYQGEAGNPDLPLLLNGNFPLPEYLFYFDLDEDTAMSRVEKRAGSLEIYEKRDFQNKVRSRYLEIIERFEHEEKNMKVTRIDASSSIDEIAEKIWSIARNLPKM